MKLRNILQKKNKKGFLLRTWVISLLIFSGVFALLFVASNELANDYGEGDIIDEEYRENYDKFSEASDSVSEMFIDASSEEGLSIIGTVTGVFSSVFSIIRLVFGSLDIVKVQTVSFAADFGVPEVVSNIIFPLILAAATVIIIFVVISSLNRGHKL